MTSRLYLLLFVLLISSKSNSQELHFTRGGKIEQFNETFQFFAQDSSRLYAYCCNNREYFLHTFDKSTLGNTSRIKIPLPSKDTTNYNIEGIYAREDTFQVFYSYFNYLKSTQMLGLISFDRNGLRIGDNKIIDQQGGKNPKSTGFSVLHLKNSREYMTTGYSQKKDTLFISIDHFDYSGQPQKSQNVFTVGSVFYCTIDDDCNFYYLTSKKIKRGNYSWQVKIFSPFSDSSVAIQLPQLSEGKIVLSQFGRSIVNNGVLNYFVPYSSEGGANAEGIYFAQIDCKGLNLLKEQTIKFKENTDENDKFEMSSCILTNIIPYSESRFKVIFESRTFTTEAVYGIPVSKEYTLGNIVTIDIDSGVVKEFHNIKKQQVSSQSKFMYTGFALLNSKDKSFFLYNELPGNLSKPAADMKRVNMNKVDETNVIYTFVEDKKVKRKTLIDKGAEKGIDAIIPSSYYHDYSTGKIYLVHKVKEEAELIQVY